MESTAYKSLKDLLVKDAKIRVFLLGAIGAALVLYFRAFDYPFINFDDNVYVYENPLIFNFSFQNVKLFFTEFFYGGYYPLTMLSFMLDYQLFGADSSGFHKMNLLYYVLTLILLGQFLYNLFDSKILWAIPLLLFTVHPLHIESVAWISERKDVLYGLFYFAALNQYLRYLSKPKPSVYLLVMILFILSLGSKTMAVTFAPALVLIDWYKGELAWRNKNYWLSKLPFFLISLVFGIIAIYAQSDIGAITENSYSIIEKIGFGAIALWKYVLLIVLPIPALLSAYHAYPIFSILWVILSLAGIIGAVTLFILKSRKINRIIVFGALFFLIHIVLYLQFIQVNNFLIAERFTYIAMLGLLIIFAELINSISIKENQKWALAYSLAIVFFVFSFIRLPVWESSVALWNDVIEKYPQVSKAWNHRGMAHEEEGNFQKALDDYKSAIQIDSTLSQAYVNAGLIHANKNELKQAISYFTRAIEQNKEFAMAYNNRGIAFVQNNQFDKGLDDFNKAIEIDYEYAAAHKNKGIALAQKERYDDAIQSLSEAIDLDPEYAEAYFYRGQFFANRKKLNEAVRDLGKAVELGYQNPSAYFNLGVAYYNLGNRILSCENLRLASEMGHPSAKKYFNQVCQ